VLPLRQGVRVMTQRFVATTESAFEARRMCTVPANEPSACCLPME
jgi:hypothetical protein